MEDIPLTPEEEIRFAELESQGFGSQEGGSDDSPLTPEEEIRFAELEAGGYGTQEKYVDQGPKDQGMFEQLWRSDPVQGTVKWMDEQNKGLYGDIGRAITLPKDSAVTTFADTATDLPVIGEAAKMAGAEAQEIFGGIPAEEALAAHRGERAAQRSENPYASKAGDVTSYAMLPGSMIGGGAVKGAAKLGALEGIDTYMETGDLDTSLKTGLTMAAAGYGLGTVGKVAFGAGKLAMGGKAKAAKAVSEGIKSMNRGSMMHGPAGIAWRMFQRQAPKYLDKIAKGEKGAIEKFAVKLQEAEARATNVGSALKPSKKAIKAIGTPVTQSGPGFKVTNKTLKAKVADPAAKAAKKAAREAKKAEATALRDSLTKKRLKDDLRDAFTLGRAGSGNIITEITKEASNTHYLKMQTSRAYRESYMKGKKK